MFFLKDFLFICLKTTTFNKISLCLIKIDIFCKKLNKNIETSVDVTKI